MLTQYKEQAYTIRKVWLLHRNCSASRFSNFGRNTDNHFQTFNKSKVTVFKSTCLLQGFVIFKTGIRACSYIWHYKYTAPILIIIIINNSNFESLLKGQSANTHTYIK